ncbi:hypothetical protein AB0O79_12820 [Rhodoglobus sp. NPDC076798]
MRAAFAVLLVASAVSANGGEGGLSTGEGTTATPHADTVSVSDSRHIAGGNSGSGGAFATPVGGGEAQTEDENWCIIPRVPCLMPEPAEVAAAGPTSFSDLATFRPQPPTAAMQPNQWMVVGLDTNFYATASAHIVDGTLFGGTAQVRFTPIGYSWDYGDGSTANLGNAGTTWAKYKISEFDATPTSHIYDEPGEYTITLAVTYAAEYRVAGSHWQQVVGTLTLVAPPLTATAGHATTVLVDQNCNVNPTGIGC